MGTKPRVCFLGGMGGRSLVDSQDRKVGFFNFSKNYFFGGVGFGGRRNGVGGFFLSLFVFCDMVT
jgi:hypothetical protein